MNLEEESLEVFLIPREISSYKLDMLSYCTKDPIDGTPAEEFDEAWDKTGTGTYISSLFPSDTLVSKALHIIRSPITFSIKDSPNLTSSSTIKVSLFSS